MERLSEFIGAPVIDSTSGKHFGYMKDAVYSDGNIDGIVVQKRAVLTKDCFIPYASVKELNDEGVRADCSACKILTWRNNSKLKYLHNAEIGAIGEEGRQVGRVSDICFEKASGKVTGIEINRGLRCDLKNGRQILTEFELGLNENGEYEAKVKGGENSESRFDYRHDRR